MPDLEERFRALGRLGSPDLWTEIEEREPRWAPPEPSSGRRWLAATVALVVAAAGLTFAANVFRSGDHPRPTSLVTNGKVAFSGFDGQSWQIYSVEPDGSGLAQLTTVPDLETATSPAWSPDGTRLAYVVQQFHADGTTGRSDLWVMNADGSDPRPLTDGPGSSWSPAWSPDGSRIAFTTGDPASIFVIDADGSDPTRLTPDDVNASDPSWSPDGSRIVFNPDGEVEKDLYVVNTDGTGESRLLSLPGWQIEPDWSPDGQKIAFTTSSPDGAGFGVSVMDADGTDVKSLTDQPAAQSAAWSPDGRQIVFMALRSGTDHNTLYVMNADGSEVHALSGLPTEATFPSWQPVPVEATPSITPTPAPGVMPLANGQIYFRVGSGDGPSWIESIRQDGSERHVVFDQNSPVRYDRIAFSPDGSRIAFDNNLVDQYGIETANPDGSDIVRLTDGVNDSWPSWSSDGTKVFFSSKRYNPSAKRCTPGSDFTCPTDIYAMDADGSHVVRLTSDPAPEYAPIASPDGGKIAFVKVANDVGYTAIFTMEPDGAGVRQVSSADGGSDFSPSWSPDGTQLVFASIRNEDWGIWVVSADGTGEHQIVGGLGGPYVTDPVWSPDGSLIAYVQSTDHDNALFVMNPDGSGSTELASAPSYGVAGDIAWQPVLTGQVSPSPSGPPTFPPPSPTAVDPTPSARLQIAPPPGSASSLLYAFGSVWVAWFDESGARVTRIDAATNEIVATIPIEDSPGWVSGGGGIAEGFGSIWVTGGSRQGGVLQRIDPSTNRMVSAIQLGKDFYGLAADVAVDENGVWVVSMPLGKDGASFLYRVDPATDQVITEIPLEYEYERHVIAVNGAIVVRQHHWHDDGSGPYTIFTSIDASTNSVNANTSEDAFWGMWTWDGQLWAGVGDSSTGNQIVRVDPITLTAIGEAVPIDAERLGSFEAGEGGIWFVSAAGVNQWQQPFKVNRFDPETGRVDVSETVPEAGGQDMAVGDGAIWFLKDGNVLRFDFG